MLTLCNVTLRIFCVGESSQDGIHFLVLHDSSVILLHGECHFSLVLCLKIFLMSISLAFLIFVSGILNCVNFIHLQNAIIVIVL
jgi:hypothetical protein